MKNLAVIGTAGRGEDFNKLTKERWQGMNDILDMLIEKLKPTGLVSGGAAWADHLVVSRAMRWHDHSKTWWHAPVRLYLPCHFNHLDRAFEGKAIANTANRFHERFSTKIYGSPTITRDQLGIILGQEESNRELRSKIFLDVQANPDTERGFRASNALVARDSKALIAFTFGHKGVLKDGGTSHTTKLWLAQNPSGQSYHVDLNTMYLFSPASV